MVMVHGCKFFQDLLKAHVFLEHVLQTRTCYRLDSLELLNFIDWFVVFQVCLLVGFFFHAVDKHTHTHKRSWFNLKLINL